jgi:hypothetical protein
MADYPVWELSSERLRTQTADFPTKGSRLGALLIQEDL